MEGIKREIKFYPAEYNTNTKLYFYFQGKLCIVIYLWVFFPPPLSFSFSHPAVNMEMVSVSVCVCYSVYVCVFVWEGFRVCVPAHALVCLCMIVIECVSTHVACFSMCFWTCVCSYHVVDGTFRWKLLKWDWTTLNPRGRKLLQRLIQIGRASCRERV